MEQGGEAWNEAPSQGEVVHPPHPPPPPPARRCGKGAAVGALRPRGNFWNKQSSWREETNLYTRRGERKKTPCNKRERIAQGRGKIRDLCKSKAPEQLWQPRLGGWCSRLGWKQNAPTKHIKKKKKERKKEKKNKKKKNGGVWSARWWDKGADPSSWIYSKAGHSSSTYPLFLCNELSDPDYSVAFAASLTAVWFCCAFFPFCFFFTVCFGFFWVYFFPLFH